jgi:hypothetical protein
MSVDTQSQSVWKKFGAGTLIVAKLGKLADQEEEKRFMKASSFKRQQHVVKQPMEAKIPKASEKIVLNSHWSDEHYLKSLSPEAVMLGSQRFVSKPDMRTKAEKEVANDIMHKKMLEAFAIMTNNDRMFKACIQNLSSESDRYWSDDEGFDDDCLDDEADRREREYEEDLARSFRNMAEADRREREEGQAYCFRYMAKADS